MSRRGSRGRASGWTALLHWQPLPATGSRRHGWIATAGSRAFSFTASVADGRVPARPLSRGRIYKLAAFGANGDVVGSDPWSALLRVLFDRSPLASDPASPGVVRVAVSPRGPLPCNAGSARCRGPRLHTRASRQAVDRLSAPVDLAADPECRPRARAAQPLAARCGKSLSAFHRRGEHRAVVSVAFFISRRALLGGVDNDRSNDRSRRREVGDHPDPADTRFTSIG